MAGAKRVVIVALLTILAVRAEGASSPVEFIRPLDGDIVAGTTEFAFRVDETLPVQRVEVSVDGRLIGEATAPTWSFRWTSDVPLRDAEIVAVAHGVAGEVQRLSIRTADISFGEIVDVVEVQLFPVVQDRQGHYIPNLTRDDFVLLDEGREIDIETFSSQPTALTVAVVIDVSGSMFYKLQRVQQAAVGFLDALDPDDMVALYSFNHRVSRLLPPTADVEEAKRRIGALWATGRTALNDAVDRALSDLEAVPGRRILVVFSDGRDETSRTSAREIVKSARESEVVIYTVGAGEDEEDLAAREDLEAMATATGGEGHILAGLDGLPATFAAILSDVRAQYLLTFTPPPEASGVRRVEVRTRNESYRVRCRTSYVVRRTGS